MPTPAYTKEQFVLSFGEQDPTTEISTPAAAPTTWIGKLRTLTGWDKRNRLEMHYFSVDGAGGGRKPFEAVDLGVDIEGITLTYEVQNPALLALAMGHVEDVGSTPTNATTLSAPAAAGDTSVTVASATGYATNDYVQIGSGAQKPEVRQVTTVVTNTINFAKKLRRAHANGDAVTEVVAPFTHTMKVGEDFPQPFTLQGVYRPGFSNELAWQIAGCHII